MISLLGQLQRFFSLQFELEAAAYGACRVVWSKLWIAVLPFLLDWGVMPII